MSFFWFLLYYVICTIILGLIGVLIYKYILKNKMNSLSKFTEKQIDNYFDSYDKEENETNSKTSQEELIKTFMSLSENLINNQNHDKNDFLKDTRNL